MYKDVHQFEPLLPPLPHPELEALAEDLSARALDLKRLVHPVTGARIAELLRGANSYYSNRIEGQHTHPQDIERALRKDFDKAPDKARLQRLAIAHIDTQKEMESWLAADSSPSVYAPAFIARLHESFYGKLPARERVTEFGLLRALGLSPRQLGIWMALEQGLLVVSGLALGTLVGWGRGCRP